MERRHFRSEFCSVLLHQTPGDIPAIRGIRSEFKSDTVSVFPGLLRRDGFCNIEPSSAAVPHGRIFEPDAETGTDFSIRTGIRTFDLSGEIGPELSFPKILVPGGLEQFRRSGVQNQHRQKKHTEAESLPCSGKRIQRKSFLHKNSLTWLFISRTPPERPA